MSHHVHRRNDGQKDRTANLLISSNVHYAHLGGDKKIAGDWRRMNGENEKLFEINHVIAVIFSVSQLKHF